MEHYQSAHCENGVVTSLMRNKGLDFMNEPLAFGLGSGIFYVHLKQAVWDELSAKCALPVNS